MFLLLGVLQQTGSVLGSGVVLGMAQPALSVVLHPVSSVAVAQQEAVGRLSSQQQSGSWNTEELSCYSFKAPEAVQSARSENCDSTFTGLLLTFVVSMCGAVVAEESVQHGFL